VVGNFTSGGTESIILAVKTARDHARATRPEVRAPEIILPITGHAAFQKAAHYLDVNVVLVPVDAKTFKELPLPKLPSAEHVVATQVSRDGRYATLVFDTGTAPPQAWVLDWKTKALVQWWAPSTPEIDTSRIVRATLESYPARDGTPIPMFVRRPARCATEPCPVIVDFHGGPEGQSKPGFSIDAHIFVEAGFIYVEPNVRGSDGYGKKWLHADDGARRLEVISDIEDCARYIRTAWAKNGRAPKIGVTGGSYGGYSTLMAMTYFAGAYDAGAEIVGMSNLLTFLENTAPYRRILRASEYGDPEKERDLLLKLSPLTYIDRVRAPMLLIQGANDPRVPVGEALQIQAALEAKKIPNTLLIFADEGHGASKRSNVAAEMGYLLRFFKEHLQER
jgi:dipeptidyl aminopeptidase/acylaminoacyl peptidase